MYGELMLLSLTSSLLPAVSRYAYLLDAVVSRYLPFLRQFLASNSVCNNGSPEWLDFPQKCLVSVR